MSKKTNIQTAIKKVSDISGKGPYMASEIMTGSKCMSTKRGPFTNNQPSKMSSAHGTNGQSKNNNMNQGGGNRIGANCRTFKKESYPVAGPNKPYPKHAGQPSGHKDKA